jgi:hypothetical protein
VIAVDQRGDSVHCFVTAYSERRALDGCSIGLVPEGTFGTSQQLRKRLPKQIFEAYRRRAALNDRIFAGDPNAARQASLDYNVRYVIFLPGRSSRTSRSIAKLAGATQRVYHNSEVTILRIRASKGLEPRKAHATGAIARRGLCSSVQAVS